MYAVLTDLYDIHNLFKGLQSMIHGEKNQMMKTMNRSILCPIPILTQCMGTKHLTHPLVCILLPLCMEIHFLFIIHLHQFTERGERKGAEVNDILYDIYLSLNFVCLGAFFILSALHI